MTMMPNETQRTSPGTELNRLLDAMGMPDHVGDLYGAALDNAIHDDWGVARNLLDAFSGISTSDLDKYMSGQGGMGEPGYCPKPREGYDRYPDNTDTYYDREKIHAFKLPFGNMSAFKIDGKTVDVGQSMSPAEFERKLKRDPEFRDDIERQLGGARIVFDNRNDGRLTLAKSMDEPARPRGFADILNRMRDRVVGGSQYSSSPVVRDHRYQNEPVVRDHRSYSASSRPVVRDHRAGSAGSGGVEVRDHRDSATIRDHRRHAISSELANFLRDRLGDQPIHVRPFPGRETGEEIGGPGSYQPSSKLTDILNDPNLPFEEKLALFCFAFLEEKQKEIEKKMGEMSKRQKDKENGGGGGFLSKAASIGGAAIGAAYGGPAGAMAGEKIGSFVGGAIEGKGGGKEGEDSEQIAMMKLNQEVQAMEKMFSTVENILKSMNDVVKQGPIASLRG
jgi:hypothetical protein